MTVKSIHFSPYAAAPCKPSLQLRMLKAFFSPALNLKIAATILFGLGYWAPGIAAIAAGAVLGIGVAYQIRTGGEALLPGIFLGPEHLSQEVDGGNAVLILPAVLESLDQLDGPNAQVARQCIEALLIYDLEILKGNTAPAQDLLERLQPEEIMAVPCNTKVHVMIGTIACKPNGKYTLRIHNAGAGSQHHHSSVLESNSGCQMVQSAYEIDEVEKGRLHSFIAELPRLCSEMNADELYKELIPKLGGVQCGKNSDRRLWIETQSGGSCSGYSVKCLLRFLLSDREYRKFETIFLAQSADKLRSGLSGPPWRFSEQTSLHVRALKEIELMRGKMNGSSPLPPLPELSSFAKLIEKRSHSDAGEAPLLPIEMTMLKLDAMIAQFGPFIADPYWFADTDFFGADLSLEERATSRSAILRLWRSLSAEARADLGLSYDSLIADLNQDIAHEVLAVRVERNRRMLSKLKAFLLSACDRQKDLEPTSLSKKFSRAIDLYQQGRFEEAALVFVSALRKAKRVPKKKAEAEISRCFFLFYQAFPHETFKGRIVSDARSWEEIECHLACASVFETLRRKVGVNGRRYVPATWNAEFRCYAEMGLHRRIPRQPWTRNMERIYQDHQRRVALAPIASRSVG